MTKDDVSVQPIECPAPVHTHDEVSRLAACHSVEWRRGQQRLAACTSAAFAPVLEAARAKPAGVAFAGLPRAARPQHRRLTAEWYGVEACIEQIGKDGHITHVTEVVAPPDVDGVGGGDEDHDR